MSSFSTFLHLYPSLPHSLLLKKSLCLLKITLPTCPHRLCICLLIALSKSFSALPFPLAMNLFSLYPSRRILFESCIPVQISPFIYSLFRNDFSRIVYTFCLHCPTSHLLIPLQFGLYLPILAPLKNCLFQGYL